jgi:membrane-bound lytic murein transglycosylase B
MLNRLIRSIVLFALAGLAGLVVSTAAAQDTPPPSPPSPSLPPFADFLAELRKEALSRGISERTVEAALTGLEPLPIVVERDRTQAERTLTIDQYVKRRVDRKTIRTARERARLHAALLKKVSAQYGVSPSIIVAIWGLESNFGRFSGVRPTIASLATLAYDNRRSAMFREELLAALQMVDRGDIDLAKMKGSWAGAMGQPQFMPSSYLEYAEDFDKDGAKDIWGSTADVFASTANFLKQKGWTAGARWGVAVTVPPAADEKIAAAAPLRGTGCEAVRQMTAAIPLARWKALGVRPAAARAVLPRPDTTASLVRAGSRNFLVFENYSVLLQYNCAHAYALAVGLLADQIK